MTLLTVLNERILFGSKFHEANPNAHIFLKSMKCYEIRDVLLAGSIDLGVFYQDIGGFGDPVISYQAVNTLFH